MSGTTEGGGRVVVVTGGSRGIGRAACAAYAARGDTVVVASRRAEACAALAAELTARHGVPALPGELPYALAKAGLNALTVGLARAYAPSVRVNTVMPGPVRTDIAEHWTEEFRAHVAGTVPAGRVGEAAEVVGAILYLTGPDAGYTTTGATIKVDGGMAWST